MILKGSIWCTDGDQASVNTVFYKVVSVGTPASTDADFAQTLDSAIGAVLITMLNNNASYRGVQGQIVFPLPVRVAAFNTASAGAGTSGATALPRQASGLISWKTNLAGRKFRGRTYIPFPATTSDTGNGIPTAGYITALSSFATALLNMTALATGCLTSTISLGVHSRVAHTTTDISSSLSQNRWATQRRRGSYGRQNISPL